MRDAKSGIPSFDYLRDGVLDLKRFIELKTSALSPRNDLLKTLKSAADTVKGKKDAFVAVFGSGYPDQDDRPQGPGNNPLRTALGFTGIDNVHMNQGNYLRVGTHQTPRFEENGAHQDGGVLFFLPIGKVIGFFLKFSDQATVTDEFGNPTDTGVSELDSTKQIKPSIRKKLLARSVILNKMKNAFAAKTVLGGGRQGDLDHGKDDDAGRKATPAVSVPSPNEIPISGTSGGNTADGFIFNDPNPADDPNLPFKTDDDSQYWYSPFVANFAEHGVPEPVPGPRNGVYPVMQLQDVIGKAAATAIAKSNQIIFHVAGDTGAPAEAKLPNETSVADLMVKDFDPGIDKSNVPAFFYHVGDVVYYYGEEDYYYSQFYRPYIDYPAPILPFRETTTALPINPRWYP